MKKTVKLGLLAISIEQNWRKIIRLRKKANRLINAGKALPTSRLRVLDRKITRLGDHALSAQERYEQLLKTA